MAVIEGLLSVLGILGFLAFIGFGSHWIAEKLFGVRIIGKGSYAARQALAIERSESSLFDSYSILRPEVIEEATARCKRKLFAPTKSNILNEVRKIEKERNLIPFTVQDSNSFFQSIIDEEDRKTKKFLDSINEITKRRLVAKK
jgi:hypothetical protein